MIMAESASSNRSIRHFSPRRCGALAILFLAYVAKAQTASDQDYLNSLSIEDLTKVKVFSASRRLEDARRAPAAVTIITADEIKRYGWRTLGEVLRSVRGFHTATDRQYTYLGVRGILHPGDFNTRILLQINGHRLNDNIYDQAMLGTEFPLDLDLIDHIEIVRGPGSTMFGSNAMFAVVDVITRQPQAATVETSGETGSFLTRGGRISASSIKNSWSGLISGTLYRSNGPDKLFFPEFASPTTNNGIAESMDWDRVGQAFVDADHGNLRLQGLFSNRSKSIPTASYGAIFNDPATLDRDTRGAVDLSDAVKLSSTADLDLRTYYDSYEYYGPIAYSDSTGRTIQITRQRADWIGTEANLGFALGKQRITLGTEYEYTFNASQQNYIPGQLPSFSVDDNPWLSAIYGEAELNLIPKVTFRAGARVDWFSTFGAAASPRFAVIYSPSRKTTWKYIAGRAFRAPSVSEEFYVDNISIEAPPRPLSPEEIWSHEIVFEHSLRPWLSVTADGYFEDLNGVIENVASPQPGLSYVVNEGHDQGKGAEIELEAKRALGLAAKINYALTDVHEVQKNSAAEPNSPQHQVKLNGTIPIRGKAFAGLELLYFSKQQSYRGTAVPATVLGNVTFSSRPLWQNWEFSASCYNALNRGWYSPMGPNDPEAAIRMDGRSFRFKVTYRANREARQ